MRRAIRVAVAAGWSWALLAQGGPIDINRQTRGNLPGSRVTGLPAANSTWTQTGTGAVSRTVDAKLKEVISLLDFGAVGSPTDDKLAIQAALNAAAGKILVIPKGTWVSSAVLTIPANTTVMGEGWASVLTTTASRALYVSGVDGVTVQNLAISCTDPTVARYGVAIDGGSSYATVSGVKVSNCGQYGIVVSDSGTAGGGAGHKIINNTVDMTGAVIGNTPIGIEIFPRGGAGFLANPGVRIEGNIVVGTSGILAGIKVNAQKNAMISGNRVSGVTYSSATGAIQVTSSTGTIVHRNILDTFLTGIALSGTAGADNGLKTSNVVVEANQMLNARGYGVYCNDGVSGVRISGNVVTIAVGYYPYGIALALSSTSYAEEVITENRLSGVGIYLPSSGGFAHPNAFIANNFISDDGGNSIEVQGDDIVVQGNYTVRPKANGIFCTGNRCMVRENVVIDANAGNTADRGGIKISNGSNGVVENNYLANSTGAGLAQYSIILGNAPSTVLFNNQMLNPVTQQIYSFGSSTYTLNSLAPGGSVSAWASYTYTKTANASNGCTRAKGCWQLNGASGDGTAPAAATSQALTLFTLPANGAVTDLRIKTAVACTNSAGTATVTDVGLTGTAGYYATGLTYNLEAAVADTNLLFPAIAARGSNTAASTAVTVTVAGDSGNVEDWADGCSVKVSVRWAVIP